MKEEETHKSLVLSLRKFLEVMLQWLKTLQNQTQVLGADKPLPSIPILGLLGSMAK